MEILNDTLGDDYLEHFDKIDLSQGKEQRRIGLFTIENFYAVVMADIGRHAFRCDYSIYSDNLSQQWDRIYDRLQEVVTEKEKDGIEKYRETIKGGVKPKRYDAYHGFDRGSKDDLKEYRSAGEEMWRWLLDKGKEYQENHGVYTASEFEHVEKNVKSATEVSENYPWACTILQKDLEYAERSILKEYGHTVKFTTRLGSAAYMRGFIDKRQAGKIQRVTRVANKDYNKVDEKDGKETVKGGLEVLEILYKSLSPFHSESLLADKFVSAIEELGYDITRVDSREREVWISHRIRFDGNTMEEGGIILHPHPDGVRIDSLYFSKEEVDVLPEEDKQIITDHTRKRDELDGDEVIVIWSYHIEIDGDDLQTDLETSWPPEKDED